MPNMKWSQLGTGRMGRCAEYYAMIEFASYGYKIYATEIDDHGVDFIAKINGVCYEVQVKSMLKGSYVYIPKGSMDIKEKTRLVCFLHFTENEPPQVYIIPATAWQKPNTLLKSKDYILSTHKSPPEWGIQYSKRNLPLIEKYCAENFFAKHKL